MALLRLPRDKECPYIVVPARRWKYVFDHPALVDQAGFAVLDNFLKQYHAKCRWAKLPEAVFHALRKTCITNWLEGRVPQHPKNRVFSPKKAIATGRTRTDDLRFTKPPPDSITDATPSTYENPDESARNARPQSFAELTANDADLDAVVAAWPGLPGAIRAGILAMVNAAGKGGER